MIRKRPLEVDASGRKPKERASLNPALLFASKESTKARVDAGRVSGSTQAARVSQNATQTSSLTDANTARLTGRLSMSSHARTTPHAISAGSTENARGQSTIRPRNLPLEGWNRSQIPSKHVSAPPTTALGIGPREPHRPKGKSSASASTAGSAQGLRQDQRKIGLDLATARTAVISGSLQPTRDLMPTVEDLDEDEDPLAMKTGVPQSQVPPRRRPGFPMSTRPSTIPRPHAPSSAPTAEGSYGKSIDASPEQRVAAKPIAKATKTRYRIVDSESEGDEANHLDRRTSIEHAVSPFEEKRAQKASEEDEYRDEMGEQEDNDDELLGERSILITKVRIILLTVLSFDTNRMSVLHVSAVPGNQLRYWKTTCSLYFRRW